MWQLRRPEPATRDSAGPAAPASSGPAVSELRRRESRRPALLQLLREQLVQAPAAGGGKPSRAAPLDGERKQVTVLFADVKGSMDMAEQHDPEEWRQIMQRFFSILSDGVHRFEGTVDKFTGDGIMAALRRPDRARGPRPARLLRGSADARRASPSTRPSCGAPGAQLLGPDRDQLGRGGGRRDRRGRRARLHRVGHTVGLAQRMEALAEPGKAYLTEHAARLAEGYLELKDLGEFEVKGASRPIGCSSWSGRARRARGSTSRGSAASCASSAEPRRWRCSRRRSSGPRRGEGPWSASSPSPASARAGSATSSRSAAGQRGIDVYEAQARRTARRSRSCRCCRCCAATSGSRTGTPSGRRARRSPAGCCCSIPTSPTTCR